MTAPAVRSVPIPGFDMDAVLTATADLVGVLRRIPVSARRFTAGRKVAWYGFRLDDTVMSAAVAAGLPHAGTGDGRLFDWMDLSNLAVDLPLATPQRTGTRFWANTLRRSAEGPQQYEVSFHPYCPTPGHPGRCEYLLHAPDDIEVPLSGPEATYSTVRTLRPDWPTFTGPFRDVIDEVAGVRFMRLPDAIRGDVNFAATHGIADCLGFALLLTEVARRAGIVARPRFGIIVSLPYSIQHAWAEFRIDDRWVPCDTGFVDALYRWRMLPPGSWDRYRSSGSLLVGHSSSHPQIITHGAFGTDMSLPTRPV